MKKLFKRILVLTLIGGIAYAGIDTSNKLKLGDGLGTDKTIEFHKGLGSGNPKIKWNNATNTLQFANDGLSFTDFGAGGGGGGSSAGVDQLDLACRMEKVGVFTDTPADALKSCFKSQLPATEMWLLENYTSGNTTLTAVVNPTFLETSNKVFDGATGYAAITGFDATTITTSATAKIGSNSLSWAKAGTAVNSGVAKDLGSGNTVNLSGSDELWMFVNMSTATNLVSIGARFSEDANVDSNYRQILASTQWDGSALASGWNLIKLTLTDGTTAGSGWSKTSNMLRAWGPMVVSSSSGQTYTILVDSVVFNQSDSDLAVQIGDEMTIHDNSNQNDFKIDSTSALNRGIVTLAADIGTSYTAGTSTFIKRNTLSVTSIGGLLRMVDGLSGAVNLSQVVRTKQFLTSNLTNGAMDLSLIEATPLCFEVDQVMSTTVIKIKDSGDNSAQFLNTDSVHVFQVVKSNGKRNFVSRNLTLTLSVNSSHAAGLTTLTTGTNTGIAVNDYVCKNDTTVQVSAATSTANESFNTALTPLTIYMDDLGIPYPGAGSVFGDFPLGGAVNPLTSRKGIAPAFSETAGPTNKAREFLNGLYGSGPFVSGGLYSFTAAGDVLSGDTALGGGTLSVSVWIYFTGAVSNTEYLFGSGSSNIAGNTWGVHRINPSGALGLVGSALTTIATTSVATTGVWHHVAVSWEDNVAQNIYLDGVKTTGTPFNHTGTVGGAFTVGDVTGGASNPATQDYFADMKLWTGYKLTDADVLAIYNGGKHVILGENPSLRKKYNTGALTGQKYTVKAKLVRRTTAVQPSIVSITSKKQ